MVNKKRSLLLRHVKVDENLDINPWVPNNVGNKKRLWTVSTLLKISYSFFDHLYFVFKNQACQQYSFEILSLMYLYFLL